MFVDLATQRVSTLNIAQTRTSHSDAQKALELEAYGGRVNKQVYALTWLSLVAHCSSKRPLIHSETPPRVFPEESGARM